MVSSFAQKPSLTYYLPDESYDKDFPEPEELLGYQVGEWHVSHDKLDEYMRRMANLSSKAKYVEYAKSHEHRPLSYLIITSDKNHARLADIKADHAKLRTNKAEEVDIDNLPAILYQGYGVHGNESSGTNAAMLVCYYLLAGESDYVKQLLDNVVILLDPCFNPDGFNRFASWVNSNKHLHLNPDENSREFSETWPGGRTNHYWFDLNRDWLFVIHPSSKGRIQNFHEWHPNVLTDHHEMGKNSTFFFQPGVPSRTNPMTPQLNQQLTEEIGEFHAAALDSIGSKYFTKERFDDYYYGKGSTYPDINGCIGILFEQASSRGHLQETKNGLLSYPFTIRNQVITSFSTHKATLNKRKELLSYMRDFYQTSRQMAKDDPIKAYQFSHDDPYVSKYFADVLKTHSIKVDEIRSINNNKPSYVVPCAQDQYRLIKTMFDSVDKFPDSIFYDVSTWSFPLSLNLNVQSVQSPESLERLRSTTTSTGSENEINTWVIPSNIYHMPSVVSCLQAKDINIRIMQEDYEKKDVSIKKGSFFFSNQAENWDEIKQTLDSLSLALGFSIEQHALAKRIIKKMKTGKLSQVGKTGLLVGRGLGAYDAGYLWHQFDVHWNEQISHLDIDRLAFINLAKYKTIIIPNLNESISTEHFDRLKKWIKEGGHLIIVKSNLDVFDEAGFLQAKRSTNQVLKALENNKDASDAKAAQVIGGAILQSSLNLDHPFCYGYTASNLPVFHQGNIFYKSTELKPVIKYAAPVALSGYISEENKRIANGKSVVSTKAMNEGRITHFSVNPSFRGYFMATHRLLANAVFFESLVNEE